MDSKVFVRRIYIDDDYERDKIRDMLNRMGFYVLRNYSPQIVNGKDAWVVDGIVVYAIKATPEGLVEWFKSIFA